ncbi:hypothetical protein Daus18300_011515 [Diaporthe australafricana]|uniref:Dipeptidyl peptidase III n=1 Tax=Diaporthe australafricana TaxID=127596 RepID=A0ABR3W653_9PEZI
MASSLRRVHEATHRVEAGNVFDSLAKDEAEDQQPYRRYVHHLARACWNGGRVMLRQSSPEAEGIFDFILELHRACNGRWESFHDYGVGDEDLDMWLEFAGMFLSALGNFFDDGDRKVIPGISKEALRKMATISPAASTKLEEILDPMTSPQPAMLGYPSDTSQSSYYLGNERIRKVELEAIKKIMDVNNIAPENTRLRKVSRSEESTHEQTVFEILQASSEKDPEPQFLADVNLEGQLSAKLYLCRGDNSEQMAKICADLDEACRYATTNEQKMALSKLVDSFRTGNYEDFRLAHKIWVTDKAPQVEHCMGFLFGYRDPYGARAEWQAAAGIAQSDETSQMRQLVEMSTELIRTLPWAIASENDGKGPFEPSEIDVPDFAIIHVLASVSSTVWEATNITIDDEGKRIGIKSMVYGNRLSLNNSPGRPCHYVHPSENEAYMSAAHIVRHVGTVIHELIGHGTGKLLTETAPGQFNYDPGNPPISPVTGQAVQSWYKPGETWTSVFGKLAPTVEECRAFLMSSYLADNKSILELFGYNQDSVPTADDLTYFAYLQIGVEGLRALRSFNAAQQVWGGDHDQAQFAIFKHILEDGNGVMWIEQDPAAPALFVHVDRSKILSHGKLSIGHMLCKIHVWRSTADVDACRPFYESLSAVDGEYEVWRQIVVSKHEPKWKFVQPNTFLRDDGTIELKEYEPNNVGIIQSFFERDL